MAICRFWQQGNCRNGNNCRFEHPGASGQQSTNRFGPLAAGSSNQPMGARELPFFLSKEVLHRDLAEERPPWILSAFGPGKDAPDQLFGGYPMEQSFEEIRLHYLKGQSSGNPQGALTEIEALYNQAKQRIDSAASNLDGAIQFILDSEKNHPNRIDICQQNTRPGGPTGEFMVGRQSSAGQTSAFSQSSPFGAPSTTQSNPFGAPASQPTAGGFGQPPSLGRLPNPFGSDAALSQPAAAPAFGQPSQPTSAFGQPSQLGGASAFGQPAQQLESSLALGYASAFGGKPTAFAAPSFGQPSQPSQPSQSASGFGQTSALGQKPNPFAPAGAAGASPFGAPAQTQTATPFGQPAQSQNASPFGQPSQAQSASPFGQPSSTVAPSTQNANPFGQPANNAVQTGATPFGQPQTSNAFTQPSQSAPFGAPSNATSNPFGGGGGPTPSPFGAPAGNAGGSAAPNPFQTATQAPGASPFGGAGPVSQAPAPGAGPYAPDASRQHPPVESYASKGPDGRLRMFKGKAVAYRHLKSDDKEKETPVIANFDGSVAKIWFPDGAPPYNRDTEAEDAAAYTPPVMQQWKVFVETGKFAGGMVPEVPPKREFCAWDF